jgi:hypothetical protein
MDMRESIPGGRHLALLATATAAALTLAPSSAHGDSASTSQPDEPSDRSQAAERGVRGNCTWGLLCGQIKNRDRQQSIRITTSWGRKWDRATWRSVKPGQTGRQGWYKIFDGQYIQVSDIRC